MERVIRVQREAGRTGSVDLTPYAGKQVELSISYASDWGDAGPRCVRRRHHGRRGHDGADVVRDRPRRLDGGRCAGRLGGERANDWIRTTTAFDEGAGVTTPDTVYVGFGAEGLTTQAMRNDLVRRSLDPPARVRRSGSLPATPVRASGPGSPVNLK